MVYGTAWKKERTADLVAEALKLGFRGIDTACQPKHYYEKGVGDAIHALMKSEKEGGIGLKREDVYLQTKFTSVDGQDPRNIPYDKNGPLSTQVQQSIEKSLENLRTSYIDSILLHGPLRTHEDNLVVWKTLERFVDDGKVYQLGVSNFYKVSELKKLYDDVRIKPKILQNRFHEDTGYDLTIRQFCNEYNIIYQSFWTLTANPHILRNVDVINFARRRSKTPAQLFFAYLMQCGIVPLTGCTSEVHMIEDLDAMQLQLTPEEMSTFDHFVN